ncbi:uncharacterized protein VTP21DRAFT_6199 [Calcarisporiella thermophila]|uniref:uncharacterized protein n=1 Tax=Calcarisporiella thermophila TaxID=911321 RepID=UPI00374243DD
MISIYICLYFLLLGSFAAARLVSVQIVLPPQSDFSIKCNVAYLIQAGAAAACSRSQGMCEAQPAIVPPTQKLEEYSHALIKASQSDLIIALGQQAADAWNSVGQNIVNNSTFVILDYEYPSSAPNVASAVFLEEHEGFLAGIVAGLFARDLNRLPAVISGSNSTSLSYTRLVNGFANGVKSVCSECGVLCIYAESLVKNVLGEYYAQIFLKHGADVLWNAGGGAMGTAALKAFAVAGKPVIGHGTDQWCSDWAVGALPNSQQVLTSIVRNYTVLVQAIIDLYLANRLKLGMTTLFGIESGAISYAPCNEACDLVTPGMRYDVNKAAEMIWSGQSRWISTKDSGSKTD